MAALYFILLSHSGATDLRRDLDVTPELLAQCWTDRAGEAVAPALRFGAEGPFYRLLFEKPSLRTRMTLSWRSSSSAATAVARRPIGEREPLKDVARNLDRWTDAIVGADVLAADHGELADWSRSGHQRAERSVPSLPGACGHVHAARSSSASCAG